MIPIQTEWYASLVKPSFQPPNWLFPIAWSIIYLLLGIAGGLILKAKDWIAFVVYLINLVLNILWTFLFFKLHLIFIAFIEIIVLWLSIIIMIIFFKKSSKVAAWLLAPYLLWVTFAAVLNLAIYLLN